jgi:hypothetical protein
MSRCSYDFDSRVDLIILGMVFPKVIAASSAKINKYCGGEKT